MTNNQCGSTPRSTTNNQNLVLVYIWQTSDPSRSYLYPGSECSCLLVLQYSVIEIIARQRGEQRHAEIDAGIECLGSLKQKAGRTERHRLRGAVEPIHHLIIDVEPDDDRRRRVRLGIALDAAQG